MHHTFKSQRKLSVVRVSLKPCYKLHSQHNQSRDVLPRRRSELLVQLCPRARNSLQYGALPAGSILKRPKIGSLCVSWDDLSGRDQLQCYQRVLFLWLTFAYQLASTRTQYAARKTFIRSTKSPFTVTDYPIERRPLINRELNLVTEIVESMCSISLIRSRHMIISINLIKMRYARKFAMRGLEISPV